MSEHFSKQYGPWAFIAGGSEGIGLSFARRFALCGLNLILVARHQETLDITANRIRNEYGVEVRCFTLDLTAPDLMARVAELTEGLDIGLLVYNAGASRHARLFLDDSVESAANMVALNCNGPLQLCHYFGSRMRERGSGGIILVGSMAGFVGSAYNATYCAAKAFESILAESLWCEFKLHHIDVLGLIAGAVDTPAMARSGIEFGDYLPMSPDDVVNEGLEQLGKTPLWIAGQGNREAAVLLRGEHRERAIDLMSAGTAALHRKPYPLVPASGIN